MASRKKQESLPLKGCTAPPTSTEQYLKICKAHPLWRHDSLISSYWWERGVGWWCGARGLTHLWSCAGYLEQDGGCSEAGRGGKMYFCILFLLLLLELGFWGRDWALGYVSARCVHPNLRFCSYFFISEGPKS